MSFRITKYANALKIQMATKPCLINYKCAHFKFQPPIGSICTVAQLKLGNTAEPAYIRL